MRRVKSSTKEAGPRVVEARFVAAAQTPQSLPAPVSVEVAFAGRSNVGKSSLLSSLVARKNLVRTSSTPGCTRQINFYEVRLADGTSLQFVDLPGYGYAKRSKAERASWATLIETYLLERPALALVIVLVDVRRGLEDEERELLSLIETSESKNRRTPKALLVATKMDRLANAKRKPEL